MLQEYRVIRSAAQVADRHISFRLCGGDAPAVADGFSWRLDGLGPGLAFLLPTVVDGSSAGGWNRFGHVAQKLFQAGHGGGPEFWPRDRDVHIEVGGGIGQFTLMLLAPFGGSDQTLFFSVPASENDRPLRPPARFQQFAQPVYGLQHRRCAAVRVNRSVHPGVAVIARDNPFVGIFTSAHSPNHIPNSAELVILFEMHLHFYRTGPQVISKR